MNHAAYPDLVADDVVWNASQLRHHLEVFPGGQLVAEVEGRLAGAISTLVVSKESALSHHSWLDITANGTFATHDAAGDTLYLADVYVHPDFWGKGVAAALYEALWSLCRELGRARVVAGGRLWGYHEYADRLGAEEYVAEVLAGKIRDRVLCSQVRAGFVVRGVLPEYLQDARSRSYATLLEWPCTPAARDRQGDAVIVAMRRTASVDPHVQLRSSSSPSSSPSA